ncbi:HTH-type transcriptional regulator CynR [Pigmentiphaga humi]|uniref:HTH-type transcriptional regulator CynR n=1 Tax=Pigmentiphaga humi TaxID=2478468 RepID=A0A3P4AY93_9BURK|nr:LysR family transcriptional regulator [Pigmentiphaga humi]VCU68346.1 HTH-type transcriptional regulator CynR [Pigmentiphaga humi]
MNQADLRLFIEVAEAGSFTKVAAARMTVQSHISRQIGNLEQECGGRLFRRTGRGVVLTELGERIIARVRGWLADTDQLFHDIRATSSVPMGEVRLGILPSAAHPLITTLFGRLRRHYPLIRLNVREGQGGELDALLDAGAVDMAILFRYHKPDSSEERLLATGHTYLVSRPGDVLTREASLDFARLQGLPLVLPRRPAHWRAILDETARSKGFALDAVIEADSLTAQKELAIRHGVYAVLGPYSIMLELQQGTLQAARLVSPDLRRYVTLALPKTGVLTSAGQVVSTMLQQLVEEWGAELCPPVASPAPSRKRARPAG